MMNVCHFMGRLTKDPEPKDVGVTEFSVAVNESYKNKEGDRKEVTTFVDCEAWNGIGKIIAQYFKKGRQIIVHGALRQHVYDNNEGKKVYRTILRVTDFQFMNDGNGGVSEKSDKTEEKSTSNKSETASKDDIPF